MVVSSAHPKGRAFRRVLFAPIAEGIQMKRKDGARTQHHEGLSNVMTVREVSAYLKVDQSTIYRLLKRHRIPAFHMGSD